MQYHRSSKFKLTISWAFFLLMYVLYDRLSYTSTIIYLWFFNHKKALYNTGLKTESKTFYLVSLNSASTTFGSAAVDSVWAAPSAGASAGFSASVLIL